MYQSTLKNELYHKKKLKRETEIMREGNRQLKNCFYSYLFDFFFVLSMALCLLNTHTTNNTGSIWVLGGISILIRMSERYLNFFIVIYQGLSKQMWITFLSVLKDRLFWRQICFDLWNFMKQFNVKE